MHLMPHPEIQLQHNKRCGWLNRPWWLGFLFLALLPASALEVQQVRWGFDGQVVPGHFNLLSVLVANSSDVPFDGTVNFYKGRGMAERVGAIYGAPCYVSPQSARWVQFYVYIESSFDEWRLEWGHGTGDHQDLDPPKWGPPGQVFLSDFELSPGGASSAFRQFPDELFPPTVAATGGLESLLLDHAPRWEPAKRQAFLDWLRAGGKVHLLRGPDGRYPVFSDEMAVLNSSVERARVGAGLVMRHAATIHEIQPNDVQAAPTPPQDPKDEQSPAPDQTTESFFRVLSQLSQRQYDWGAIYLLAIVYAALVGPGNLLIGRKLTDYRLRIGLLLATIAGFAVIFNLVGQRGQGESNVVHSLSYARAIDGDNYDVLQWGNVFATRGADYTITHGAPHNLYATGQDYEPVNGRIQSGKDGQFVVDIPMFSHRAFMHEAEMKGASVPLKISSWKGGESLNQLVVNVGPDFIHQVLDGWAVHGNQMYPMKLGKDNLEFNAAYKLSVAAFLAQPDSQTVSMGYNYPNRSNADGTVEPEEQFRKLVKPLIAWSLRGTESAQTNAPPAADAGHVQLYVFARSPQSFSVSGSAFGREVGYVLYHFDLFKP